VKLRVGSTEWERAGGPPLALGQRLSLLKGAGAVVAGDLAGRLWWPVSRRKVHPENLAELLRRFPRNGFAGEAIRLIRQEIGRNPGGRFACPNPLFPMMVRRSAFSGETSRQLERGLSEPPLPPG